MPAPKRPNYFQSQFLVVRDFTEEQDYHREMLQLHNQLMHDWGVVGDGLKVTGSGVNLSIGAGSAIDSFGQAIVLEADTPIKIPAGQDVWITIAFQELNSTDKDDKYPPPEGSEHVTRLVPSPLIAAVTTAPPTDGKVITLAKVSANGTVDYSVRKLASSFMRVGGANDLSIGIGRQVGIGTADPRAPLHIKGDAALLNLEGDTHGFVQFYPKGFDAGRKGWLGFGSAGDSHLRIENEADGGNVVLSSVKGYVGAVCSAGGAQGIQFGNREIKFRGDGQQHFSIFANKVSKALTITKSGSNEAMDTADSHIMTLADTGNVGIGTTTPGFPLTFPNSLGDKIAIWGQSGNSFGLGVDTSLFQIHTDQQNADIAFGYGSSGSFTETMRVKGNGNVGIGTITPNAKLTVSGPDSTTSIETKEVVRLIRPGVASVKNNNSAGFLLGTFETGINGKARLDITLSGEPNAANGFGSLPDLTVMSLLSTGKVGIGTTSPAEALTVGASTAGGNYAQDGQIGWRESYKLFRAGAQRAAIGTDASGAGLQLFTGSTSDDSTARLTVDSSGNIGIGTQTPVAKLHGKAGEKLVQLSGSFSTVSDTDRQIYFMPGADISGLSAGDSLVMGDERRQVEALHTAFIRVKGTQFKARSGPLYVVRAGDIFRGDDWKGNLKVLINSDGNVGIGTTTPGFPLTFPNSLGDKIAIWGQSGNCFGLGVDNSLFQIHTDQPGADIAFGYGSSGSFTETMRVKGNGNVGIGTIIPLRGKVEIVGPPPTPNFGVTVSYLQANAAFPIMSTVDPAPAVSLYASDDIAAKRCLVFSDERIKHIQGRSDSTADLHTLLGIEVTDFRYKDVIGKGNGLHKKVVAQQVEKVFPQAVSKQTDLVPDIYQQASFVDGWIELATDLKKGERVKLITEKGEAVHEVLEVKADKFRSDFKSEGDKVFVFGREVNDFRNVDYDAIAMLNVSATQQLKKEKDEEVKALRNQIEDLQAASEALISRLQILESKMATASSLVVAKNGSNGNGRP